MSNRQPGALGRFVASLLALGLLAVGVPLLLVRVSDATLGSPNPLAGLAPWNWRTSDVGSSLSGPLDDSTVVELLVRACLAVVWVAVVVIVVTTVVEVTHMVRHAGVALPSVRGLGWAQPLARSIAVGLLVVTPLLSPRAALGASRSQPVEPVRATLTVDRLATVPTEHVDVTRQVPPASDDGTYVVQRGDSIYSIAMRLGGHGDEDRTIKLANAIVDANLGTTMADGTRFTNPAIIEPGWVLQLPASVATGAPIIPLAPLDVPASPRESSTIHVVVPGDTLWDIADDDLGAGIEWPEIWDLNAGADMGGGRTFDDPDLILPGWALEVPAADIVAASPAILDAPGAETPIDEAPVSAAAVVEARVDDAQVGAANDLPGIEPVAAEPIANTPDVDEPMITTPDAGASPVESTAIIDTTIPMVQSPPSIAAPAPTTSPSATTPNTGPSVGAPTASLPPPNTSTTTTTTNPVAADVPASDAAPDGDLSPDAPSPIRLEHAAMLAAGILALVGVRRRQRLRAARPRSRVPEPRPEVIDTERMLRQIDPGERAARVDIACRAAAFSLIGTAVQIVNVRASIDGEIVMSLSGAAESPAPFIADGTRWRLPAAVPIELLAESARRVGMPCVAFVQLGVDEDGAEVLVDLEACGTLAIEAQPTQADSVVRALAAGLATSINAEVAHLITVSLPDETVLGHRNAHRAETVDHAFELAANLVGSTSQCQATSFELRSLRTGGEVWEPAVILLAHADAADLTDGSALPTPGHGVAVVTTVGGSELPDAPARLRAGSDHWTFRFGDESIELTPLGLDRNDLEAVVDILHDAERPLVWLDESITGHADNGRDPAIDETPAPFEAMQHSVVVRLLGGVAVTDSAGTLATFERSKTVELIAWLATHRTHSTRTGARTAMWEMDVRDATFANVVSEARRALGRLVPPPDGEEWLARTLTEQLPLHPYVVTDAQLIEERLDQARLEPPALACDTLRPAVELVTAMPFAGTSYLWPDAEGITSNLVLLAITASAELAAHALSIGDTELVFWATGRGLAVLPGHEELIALRMRAHAKAGDLAGVRQEWESYERVLVADTWSDGEPAPKLLELRRDLLASTLSPPD